MRDDASNRYAKHNDLAIDYFKYDTQQVYFDGKQLYLKKKITHMFRQQLLFPTQGHGFSSPLSSSVLPLEPALPAASGYAIAEMTLQSLNMLS